MNAKEIHTKIINFLKDKGPSLPINLSKNLGISSLFASAFLSELVNQNLIKVSNLKIGGSPLYYLDGQEEKLENYYKYMHPREAEAYLLLKEHKILKDNDQDPVIRVALRAIKDFSYEFKIDNDLYWKFFSVNKEEVDKVLGLSKNKEEEIQKSKIIEEKKEIEEDKINKTQISKIIENKKEDKKERDFYNPLVIKEEKKIKDSPKSEFVVKVINFINNEGIKIIEEKSHKNKEYNCIVQIKSDLGPINFLTQAKDKKIINENDFKKLLSDAQSIPLPAFMIYNGEIGSKAKKYLIDYNSILKAKKIS